MTTGDLPSPAGRGIGAERAWARLSLVLASSPDLVALALRGEDRILCNAACARTLGLGPDATTDLTGLVGRLAPWARHRALTELLPAVEATGTWEGELAVHDVEGDVVALSVVVVALRDDGGAIDTVAAIARDVSDRAAFEDELEHRATHDALTSLPNRTLLLDRLRVAVGRAGRGRTLAALLFLDLDGFKAVNDGLGHAAGDELLARVARRIDGAVRPGDTVARLGGDEFAVLCEDLAGRDEAVAVARRIEEAVAGPLRIEGTELRMTVSVGVATSDGTREAEALVRDADAAMYRAKARGRSRAPMGSD
ncbi:MAG TPA: GGDEF domain-containing protein [Acidimicrobiales bacterium]|nr:GGDEF domain-containing protein [Acidimicrobiales bacterium]